MNDAKQLLRTVFILTASQEWTSSSCIHDCMCIHVFGIQCVRFRIFIASHPYDVYAYAFVAIPFTMLLCLQRQIMENGIESQYVWMAFGLCSYCKPIFTILNKDWHAPMPCLYQYCVQFNIMSIFYFHFHFQCFFS